MNNSSIPCPACGEVHTHDLGPLSGKKGIFQLPNPGHLYQCSTCNLFFRRPYPSPSELRELYRELPTDFWKKSKAKADYELAAEAIYRWVPAGAVLDVGCFRGDFLARLSGDYHKYGVEPAETARKAAQDQGIILVGSSINHIEAAAPMFNAITLIDVIEHLPYPLLALQTLTSLLLPGGIIVISTGNTDTLLWRLMRTDYWYYLTEHVSFFNLRWFRWAGNQLELEIVRVKKFSHFSGSKFQQWRQFFTAVAYVILTQTRQRPLFHQLICSVYPFNKANRWNSSPSTRLWPDHIQIVLRSNS